MNTCCAGAPLIVIQYWPGLLSDDDNADVDLSLAPSESGLPSLFSSAQFNIEKLAFTTPIMMC